MRTNVAARLVTGLGAVLAIVASGGGARAAEPTGRDVFLRQEEARKIRDINSEASISTGGPGADAKLKTFTWWRKLSTDGVHFRTLTRFHLPAEIRNEGILIDERNQNDN